MIDNNKDAIQQLLELYDDKELEEAVSKDEPHDYISEIADSNCDVYTYDLLEWVKGNYTHVEDAIAESDFPKDSYGKPDFIKAIMMGQHSANWEKLWEAWKKIQDYRQEWISYTEEEQKKYKTSLIFYIKEEEQINHE